MSRGQHKTSKRLRTENAAAQLGRLGGQATAKKYTAKQRQEWGKRGGRPHAVHLIMCKGETGGLCWKGDSYPARGTRQVSQSLDKVTCRECLQMAVRLELTKQRARLAQKVAVTILPVDQWPEEESADALLDRCEASVFGVAKRAVKRDRRTCSCRGIPNQVCDECMGPAGKDDRKAEE